MVVCRSGRSHCSCISPQRGVLTVESLACAVSGWQVMEAAIALSCRSDIKADIIAELTEADNIPVLQTLLRTALQSLPGRSAAGEPAATAAARWPTLPLPLLPSRTPSSPSSPSSPSATGAAGAASKAAEEAPQHAMQQRPQHPQRPAGERVRRLVPVVPGGMGVRLLVERALQPGSAAVASELLSFDGCEFRLKEW